MKSWNWKPTVPTIELVFDVLSAIASLATADRCSQTLDLGHWTLDCFPIPHSALHTPHSNAFLLSITRHHPIAQHLVWRFHRVRVDCEFLAAGILGNQFQPELIILEPLRA